MEPSLRVKVENKAASTLYPYVGAPTTFSAGQVPSQPALHTLLPGVVSASKVYRVMPLLSTRMFLPTFEFIASVTVAPRLDDANPVVVVVASGAVVPGATVVSEVFVDDLLLLPQAASASIASAPIANRRTNDVRMKPPGCGRTVGVRMRRTPGSMNPTG